MTVKSFQSRKRAPEDYLDFEVNGHAFKAKPSIPVGFLMEFSEAFGKINDKPENEEQEIQSGVQAIAAVRQLFHNALIAEDRDRFFALLNDPDEEVDIEVLMDISEWLGEQYTARPTGGASSQGSQKKASGGGSTAGAQLGASTFSRPDKPEEMISAGQLGVPAT